MFDIGANLSSSQFKTDVKEVLENAKANGITGILLTSVDLPSLECNLKIIKNYSDILFLKTTLGLHPHYAESYKEIFDNLQYIDNKDIISIGEFGLDYFRMLSKKDIQQNVMHKFLELSKSHKEKSLFLHERDAFEDFYGILKEHSVSNHSVVHCFSSNKYNMQKYLDLGCYIGFTGWISDDRRNSDVLEALKYIPLDRILIETDAPYLTPFNMPKRSRRNEPANLKYVLQTISEIKSMHTEELKEQINLNTKTFFNF